VTEYTEKRWSTSFRARRPVRDYQRRVTVVSSKHRAQNSISAGPLPTTGTGAASRCSLLSLGPYGPTAELSRPFALRPGDSCTTNGVNAGYLVVGPKQPGYDAPA
jgi:hypothetical protein